MTVHTGKGNICIYLGKGQLAQIDDLISKQVYPSRSEAIRNAIRDLINSEGT